MANEKKPIRRSHRWYANLKSDEILVGVNARVIGDLIGDRHAEVRAVHLREEIEIREDRLDHSVVVRGKQGSL